MRLSDSPCNQFVFVLHSNCITVHLSLYYQQYFHSNPLTDCPLIVLMIKLKIPLFPPTGALAWLDGSDISYSNWVNTPDTEAACGHILKHSGFRWEAKMNCSQELNFICQFGIES